MKTLIHRFILSKKKNKLYYVASSTPERAKDLGIEYVPDECYVVEVDVDIKKKGYKKPKAVQNE